MLTFFQALSSNPFIQSALVAGAAASIVGGTVGSYVVIKRIAFIAGSIAHCVLSGLGISFWLKQRYDIAWLSPLYGALLSAIFAALLIGWVHQKYREREDTLIAAIWSIGTAIGVLFIAKTPGFTGELMNFLFGNILWVSKSELLLLVALDIFVLFWIGLFYKQFLAICFDEEQALLQGVHVNALYLLLLTLIAISVVLLIQIVGTTLVITMLTIPASIANVWTGRLSHMMLLAVLLNIAFCFAGTSLSFYLNWPPGAAIALVSGGVYALSLLMRK